MNLEMFVEGIEGIFLIEGDVFVLTRIEIAGVNFIWSLDSWQFGIAATSHRIWMVVIAANLRTLSVATSLTFIRRHHNYFCN